MNIVKATTKHLDILTPLFDGYMMFYQQQSNLEKHRAYLEERLRLNEAKAFIAVADNGEGIGFTLLYPTFSSVSQARIYTLNDLFIHSDHRRKGVASALLSAAARYAKTNGAVRLHLETEASNSSAQNFYENEGWIRESNYFYYYNLQD